MSLPALIQYGVVDALLADASATGVPAAEARRWGDFGIGCCDGLGGEVILLDGQLIECTDEAPPRAVDDAETLPFVDVCTFPAVAPRPLSAGSLSAVAEAVAAALPSRNLFGAVRIDGVFDAVRIRVPRRSQAPFATLADATRDQVETVCTGIRGTLVGFWVPALYQGIAVAGIHLHFLAADRSAGGHVLDVAVTAADLRLAPLARFDLRLPTDEVFLAAAVSHADDDRIAAMESA